MAKGNIYMRKIASAPDRVEIGDIGVQVTELYGSGGDCYTYLMLTGERRGERLTLFPNKFDRVWPEPDKVTIVCEGKEVQISRESAKALNLI